MRSAHVTQLQSPRVAPEHVKKRETRVWQTKTTGATLEDFVDWAGVVDSEPAKEEEMFSLAIGFGTQMCKRLVTLEDEAISSFGEKRPGRSPSNDEAQKNWAIVLVESPNLASSDQPALGIFLNEANTYRGGGSDYEPFKC